MDKRYGSVNDTKVFELKKELASTSQGLLNIVSYFNKLKRLWDELRFISISHITLALVRPNLVFKMKKEENKVYYWGKE